MQLRCGSDLDSAGCDLRLNLLVFRALHVDGKIEAYLPLLAARSSKPAIDATIDSARTYDELKRYRPRGWSS